MVRPNANILISGASVAGPVLAYWLQRFGFRPTVVERAPSPRKTGGHAVDLFGPAVDVVERMGLGQAVRDLQTGTETIEMTSGTRRRPITIPVGDLADAIADQHVEIMRDDLTELFHDATGDVEYLFDDSIDELHEDADGIDVRFESGSNRRFDLVIGADGLHSQVRRLVFGPEEGQTEFIGAYLAVFSLPDVFGLGSEIRLYNGRGRIVVFYRVRGTDELRAVFVFTKEDQLDYHYRDIERQRALLREEFADIGWYVPQLLSHLDDAEPFYFDSVTQVTAEQWTRGRVALVGDAGYGPGPAVGGGTSLAILGAYYLAGELHTAGDHQQAFARYEKLIAPQVTSAQAYGRNAVKELTPATPVHAWARVQAARMITHLPEFMVRRLVRNDGSGPIQDIGSLPDYDQDQTSTAATTRQ